MAATCLDIITYTLRMSRVIGIGKTPKAAESEEGMAALQSLYDEWRTGSMFGTLKDCYVSSAVTAQEGRRYYVTSGGSVTDATSDYTPQFGDAYTECDYASGIGKVRQPRDLSLYEVVEADGTQTAKLYDRTGWIDLLDLELTDIAPLSGRGAYGLAACLATSGGFIAAFGAQPQDSTIALSRHFLRNIMSKMGSTQDDSGGEYF